MTPAPYTDYQPAPAGWIGKIPAHWDVERIKFSLSEKGKVIANGLPAGAISYGRVVRKDGEKILPETLASYQEVRAGEFLINPINLNYDLVSLRTALSDIDVVVSPAYIVLRADRAKLDPRYGNYLLHIFDIRHMKTLGAGIRQTIGFQDIGNCHWVLPPLQEQNTIADYLERKLSRIDSLIDRKTKFVELLGEKKIALINSSVTRGLDPDANQQQTESPWLGPVAAHWRVVPFWSLFFRSKLTGFSDEPLLSVYRELGVVPREGRDDNHNRPSEDLTLYQLVEPGDLVINKMKAWQGSVAISEYRGLVSPAYFVFKPRHQEFGKFLHFLFRSKRYVAGYLQMSKGIRVGQWDLDPYSHGRMRVPLPSLEEQKEIVAHIEAGVTKIEGLINKTKRSIQLLDEHRTALITAAVTGKIDVRNAA